MSSKKISGLLFVSFLSFAAAGQEKTVKIDLNPDNAQLIEFYDLGERGLLLYTGTDGNAVSTQKYNRLRWYAPDLSLKADVPVGDPKQNGRSSQVIAGKDCIYHIQLLIPGSSINYNITLAD